MLDPKDKNECSKYLSTGYLQHNVIKSEPAMDENISKFLGWMNKFADAKEPMELDHFFTFVSFDITGEVIFSKPFGKVTLYFYSTSPVLTVPQDSSIKGRISTAPSQ